MSTKGVNVYEREKLYKEVWNTPVIQVAKRYGVSNVAIKKICKSMNIPTPPNGYWAKLRNGKIVKETPLEQNYKGPNTKVGINPNEPINFTSAANDPLSFLNASEKERIQLVLSSIKIEIDTMLCKELQVHMSLVEAWNKKNSSMEGLKCNYRDYIYRHTDYHNGHCTKLPLFAGVMSGKGLDRIYRIISVLIDCIKAMDYQVNEDMSFNIRGEKVEYYIYEKQSYFTHIITDDELKRREKYNRKKKHDPWDKEPYIPLDDYRFNGNLLFNTKNHTYIQDNDKTLIEDRVSDMLVQLIQQSEVLKKERQAKEEKKRKQDEEWRKSNASIIDFNEEVDMLKLLLNDVNDFEVAMKIRAFADYMELKDYKNMNDELIEWARDKADWYDPTINKSDDILEIRDHNDKLIPDKKALPYRWM